MTTVYPDAVQTGMLDLQLEYEEAAWTFSGPRILQVDEVVSLIMDRVLTRRPTEVAIPWSRGFLARIGGVFPGLTRVIGRSLTSRGRKTQQRLKQTYTAED